MPTRRPTPLAIRRRVGEIVFNSSLVAEMQAIAAMRAFASRDGGTPVAHDLRLHRVGPPARELLAEGSSLERSHAWIQRLHRQGRAAARSFVARHGGDIGVRETLDVTRVFGGQHKPKLPLPPTKRRSRWRPMVAAPAR
jgi:NTE family protein